MTSPVTLTVLFLTVAAAFSIALHLWMLPAQRRLWLRPLASGRLLLFRIRRDRAFAALAIGTLAFHAAEVNLIDPLVRAWWRDVTGVDFAGVLMAVEDGVVPALSAVHWRPLTWALFWFYLVLHNTFLFTAPLLLMAMNERRLVRSLLASYPVIYLLALPGFLFFPADNPTVYLGLDSHLESIVPGSEYLFYHGTSIDNTIPSLHVGLATMITVLCLRSRNRRLRGFAKVYLPLVVVSVLYLQVHWLLDCVAGLAVGWLAARGGTSLARRWGDEHSYAGPEVAPGLSPPEAGPTTTRRRRSFFARRQG